MEGKAVPTLQFMYCTLHIQFRSGVSPNEEKLFCRPGFVTLNFQTCTAPALTKLFGEFGKILAVQGLCNIGTGVTTFHMRPQVVATTSTLHLITRDKRLLYVRSF